MSSQRLNKYLADNTNLSRRVADEAISLNKVQVNGRPAKLGMVISENDIVTLDGCKISKAVREDTIILFHKPVGYVCSKRRQKDKIVYDLLPHEYTNLKIAGRLDKDSSGLLVLTNSGKLIYELTHPKFTKNKIYTIQLNRHLQKKDLQKIINTGVDIGDKTVSKFNLYTVNEVENLWEAQLTEGRNRQIRRTFESLGYRVKHLHRIKLAEYTLGNLLPGEFIKIQ